MGNKMTSPNAQQTSSDMNQNDDMFSYGNAYQTTNIVQQHQSPSQTTTIKRLGPKDFSTNKEKYDKEEISALIATFCSGSSYDNIFSSVEQAAPEPGTYVSVFALSYATMEDINKYLISEEASPDKEMSEFISDIKKLEPANVVFNWECCSGCSDNGFGQDEITWTLLKTLIAKGFTVMFSDFSLKALIATWKSEILGPNPFASSANKMIQSPSQISSSFTLKFLPENLVDCPSAQLQKVGELCQNGEAVSHALGGTIVYTVRNDVDYSGHYELSILTVITTTDHTDQTNHPQACKIGTLSGLAGHVTLSYPSGGILLASCGHWIELVKLDVTAEAVLAAAQKQFGTEYTENLKSYLSTGTVEQQQQNLNMYSNNYVQSSAPCKYRKK